MCLDEEAGKDLLVLLMQRYSRRLLVSSEGAKGKLGAHRMWMKEVGKG